MKKLLLVLLILTSSLWAAEKRARNVILFIGDAGGLPVISLAAAYKGQPQSLFIQHMPHVGLMDTSTASAWVTDSAAAMTAIVTGSKTQGGVLSQSDSAVRGKKDGETLKTILEFAEERGLSTGVVTSDVVTGATAAACYAHSNDRGKTGEIFAELLKPRYGDGVDILVGAAGKVLQEATATTGNDIEAGLRSSRYSVLKSLEEFRPGVGRAIVLLDSNEFDLASAVRRTTEILSHNRKGYFLMVECDLHTDRLKRGLERTLLFDGIIEQTAQTVSKDTLIIFSADHSFDTPLRRGVKGESLLPPQGTETKAEAKPTIRVDGGHTGEEVLVTAQGPGAERVRGFFPNTQLFHIMMAAYGWEAGSRSGSLAVR
ncbi:MAG TPA: alkaline phosphatase [Acidobacteriota bacterium]|nr:alkaline phosphatase [Acidobacteriota bacterium]